MSSPNEAEGMENPWPMNAGEMRQLYIQEGKLFSMNAGSIDPIRIRTYPIMSVGFILFSQVMMGPTETPATRLRRNGRRRRAPEFVALSSRTAWNCGTGGAELASG